MALTPAEIDGEYEAALADAGIDRANARLYLANGMGTGGRPGAVWHVPGDELVEDERFPDASQLPDANCAEYRNLHRIVAPAQPATAVAFAALLRHELEHARQYEALGRRFLDLQRFIEDEVLPFRAGGLEGCAGALINAIPTELDCNAAASVYVSSRFARDEVAALRESDRPQLACSLVGPEPLETLPTRMIAFAFIHRSQVRRRAEDSGREVVEIVSRLYPGAGELWTKLEGHTASGWHDPPTSESSDVAPPSPSSTSPT